MERLKDLSYAQRDRLAYVEQRRWVVGDLGRQDLTVGRILRRRSCRLTRRRLLRCACQIGADGCVNIGAGLARH